MRLVNRWIERAGPTKVSTFVSRKVVGHVDNLETNVGPASPSLPLAISSCRLSGRQNHLG